MADAYDFINDATAQQGQSVMAMESLFQQFPLDRVEAVAAQEGAADLTMALSDTKAALAQRCDGPGGDRGPTSKIYQRDDGYHVMCSSYDLYKWEDFAAKLSIFLLGLTEKDTVHFHFGTDEEIDRYWILGYHMVLVAVRNCKAKTIAMADCNWGSALTLIALACDEIRMSGMAALAFSNPFNVAELMSCEKAIYPFFQALMQRAVDVHDLLTQEQVNGIFERQDIICMTSREVTLAREARAQTKQAAALADETTA